MTVPLQLVHPNSPAADRIDALRAELAAYEANLTHELILALEEAKRHADASAFDLDTDRGQPRPALLDGVGFDHRLRGEGGVNRSDHLHLVGPETPSQRAARFLADARACAGEASEALIAELEDSLAKARDLAESEAAPVGEREVGRRIVLTLQPMLDTLKSMRARA